MTAKLNQKDFFAALEAARLPKHGGGHAFSRAWAAGELSRAQLGEWAIQHFYYIDPIPQQFAALYARLPDLDARQHLLENLLGEEMPACPEKRHPDLLRKFARACGVSAAESSPSSTVCPRSGWTSPSSIPTGFSTPIESNLDLSSGAFEVSVTCASGYQGSPTATACSTSGEYALGGECTASSPDPATDDNEVDEAPSVAPSSVSHAATRSLGVAATGVCALLFALV